MRLDELTGNYRVIYADPPWHYSNWKGKDNGAAKAHYTCLRTKDIAALPVGNLAAEDAALALWITGPKLAEGAHMPIMKAWGFRPVTMLFVWNKTYSHGGAYTGLGFYTRSGAEFCLLGIRGKCPRHQGATNVPQVATLPRAARHSQKPTLFRARIEQLWNGPYVELFARSAFPGWDRWGQEAPDEV